MQYLQHAWDNTNTGWGKAAIVLFYAFVWFQILWAIQILIVPFAGFRCYTNAMTADEIVTVKAYLRMLNIFTVGFFAYADRGGIKVWNVTMVFVVYLLFSIVGLNYTKATMNMEALEACTASGAAMIKVLWITLVWMAVALGCSFADSKAGTSSTEETAPLV
jgi:hypothetical protein